MIAIILVIIVIAVVIGALYMINAGFKKLEQNSVGPAPAPSPIAPAPAPAPPAAEEDDPVGDDDGDNIETYISPFD